MKNKIYILFGFLLLPYFQKQICAQAILHTTISTVSNSSPVIGDQLSVFTQLQNVSLTDTFKGIINFDLANKDSIIENVSILGKPNYNGTFITLAPLETKAGLFTVQIIAPNFVAGPDIIIVWPIATAVIFDSARTNINIQAPLGIEEDEINQPMLWHNNHELFIQMNDPKNGLQGVRIFNLNGQLVLNRHLQTGSNRISIENLPCGFYLAEIEYANGDRKRMSWVK